MAKAALFLLIALTCSLAVLAKPYENEGNNREILKHNWEIFDSDRLAESYLLELYERLLKVRPAERPEASEHQPAEKPQEHILPEWIDSDDQAPDDDKPEKDEVDVKNATSAKPAIDGEVDREKEEQIPDEMPSKDSEGKHEEAPKEDENAKKSDEKQLDAQKPEEQRQPPKRDNAQKRPGKEESQRGKPKLGDKRPGDRINRPALPEPQQGDQPIKPDQKPDGRSASPLVQINVNLASK
ncbi:uncharacterized protein LOC128724377 [Anopheles nili]|uniref:uncharacterized protein LOC128724377 n=1 Tax=Anopheles nili TaxID=185578 RepID=UPI00237BD259|nr:uncharacterized protein LOC128724377 [Anopheles nili]